MKRVGYLFLVASWFWFGFGWCQFIQCNIGGKIFKTGLLRLHCNKCFLGGIFQFQSITELKETPLIILALGESSRIDGFLVVGLRVIEHYHLVEHNPYLTCQRLSKHHSNELAHPSPFPTFKFVSVHPCPITRKVYETCRIGCKLTS